MSAVRTFCAFILCPSVGWPVCLPASPYSSPSFARQCVAGLLGVVTVAGPLPMNFNINRFRDPDDVVSLELLKTITVSLVAWFKCSHFSHIPDLARDFCTGTGNGRRQLSTSHLDSRKKVHSIFHVWQIFLRLLHRSAFGVRRRQPSSQIGQ